MSKENYELKKSNYRNVYSELISKYLKIEEKNLKFLNIISALIVPPLLVREFLKN